MPSLAAVSFWEIINNRLYIIYVAFRLSVFEKIQLHIQ